MTSSYVTTLVCLGGVLIAATLGTYLLVKDEEAPLISPVATERFDQRITFVSAKTNETIDLVFTADKVTLSGLGFEALPLSLVQSDSGPRYESRQEHLQVLPKGNEVSVYRGRREIFSGTDVRVVADGITPPVIITPEPDQEPKEATTTPPVQETESDSASTTNEVVD